MPDQELSSNIYDENFESRVQHNEILFSDAMGMLKCRIRQQLDSADSALRFGLGLEQIRQRTSFVQHL